MLPVEIKYLAIVWSDPETVIKVECSHEALDLEQTVSGWLVETTAFPSMHHYIGISIKERHIEHTPYFELVGGQRQELMPIKVPGTEDIWWIQDSGWDKKNKRYWSSLYRTAGRAELVVQNQRLTIENNTFNFTIDELEYYLADFKNSLWMLILDDNSIAKGRVNKNVPDCFNDDVVCMFHDFIESVEKIIKKPGMTLAETQGKQPLRSVRPVPRTFREYATKPNAKLLTSRTYRESYDTAENRYIHYCVKRVLFVLRSLARVADAQATSYAQKIEQEHEWKMQVQSTNTKQVDSCVYDNEIAKLENDLEGLNQGLISDSFSDVGFRDKEKYGTYTFQLGKHYGKSLTEFFANELYGDGSYKFDGSYSVVRFPDSTDVSKIRDQKYRCKFKISGWHSISQEINKSRNIYNKLEFYQVTSALIDGHPWQAQLSQLIKNREKLERDNWVVPWTQEEIQDRARENEVADKKIAFFENLQQQMTGFTASLPPLIARLKKVAAFFNEHKVNTRSNCPNSMVFIQNPSYALAKSQFRKISNLNGLDEFMLNSLVKIDEIGLINISNLYEKWCLIKIIETLRETFNFDIEPGWQRKLVSAVLKKNYNIDIKFEAPDRQQSIVLSYEKELDSGKRPDFVIDLDSKEYSLEENRWVFTGSKRHRFVLDAKFRGEISEYALNELVSELCTTKNYSEDGFNQVFVIHPSPEVIKDRTSPLIWGRQCDYGQSHQSNHRYGSIFLSPSLKYAHAFDNLQRLIGLFLQESGEILKDKGDPDQSWHNMTCISCGNANENTLKLNYKPTNAGNDSWTIKCDSCGLLTVQTICVACGHALFKNGPKWTYHRTRAEQISNVICPNCETFL
ncbi:MAG: DUF2357 domain-containing protein [Thiolinea sp.]